MPANVKQIFQFGVEIVSFDYFAPFEYIDADFTETWAWSPEFDWMGYEKVTFLTQLGSIAIFIGILIVYVTIVVLVAPCRHILCCKWAKQRFQFVEAKRRSLLFVHGLFFEISVCFGVSMAMPMYWDYWNEWDKASIYISFIFGLILISYLVFVIHLTFVRAPQIALNYRAKQDRKHLKMAKTVHGDLLDKLK